MKNPITFLALASILLYAGCSSDNDDGDCRSCSVEGQKVEICDNGDDTFTFTSGDETDTISSEQLLGLSPQAFVDLICVGQ
ncbi:hypothetical protein [Spongiimicrobium sp. 3-5]|uniref:hypothetical protein n=1 Tax=Spongiimicrobium sp. 3-5 TaxID=3332596 RepID=UPI00397ED470